MRLRWSIPTAVRDWKRVLLSLLIFRDVRRCRNRLGRTVRPSSHSRTKWTPAKVASVQRRLRTNDTRKSDSDAIHALLRHSQTSHVLNDPEWHAHARANPRLWRANQRPTVSVLSQTAQSSDTVPREFFRLKTNPIPGIQLVVRERYRCRGAGVEPEDRHFVAETEQIQGQRTRTSGQPE